ncbi:MAG TPA: sigma-54 dependent transcriptional regulator [Blastocatellia bacterium]|nr:sigma-54 dependent transcriptional regulator [Blastocatellia bacterium]
MTSPNILIFDIEPSSDATKSLLTILKESASLRDCATRILRATDITADTKDDPDKFLMDFDPDLVFISLSPGANLIAAKVVSRVHAHWPALPIILLGNIEDPDAMLALLKEGARDFITAPFDAVNIILRVRRLLEIEPESPVEHIKASFGLRHLVGQNSSFVAEIGKIPIVARCDATVLISGETGTGKELCARAIHYLSPRAKHAFIPINCGAIPPDLAENELFGHERGAYTGAASSQPGIVEEAHCGTLFLDEIDCLSPLTQVKLLRFLQDKEYRRLGSSKTRRADVRIIAATNTDIEESVRQGRLRQDLYYRLHVIPLALIPLRQRTDDIPLLTGHFLNMYTSALNKRVTDISTAAMSKLALHQWPGNVRELEHVIERAVVMCEGSVLTENDITLSRSQTSASHCSFQEGKARAVSQFERNYIKGLLVTYRGNITRAAKAANKNRRAFWELIRKHRIDVNIFKQGTTH